MECTFIIYFAGPGCFHNAIRLCLAGPDPLLGTDGLQQPTSQSSHSLQQAHSTFQEAVLLIFCFMGLQLTYLTWGLLQEKIMTQEYVDSTGSKGHFTDSQFLVFVNRILAFVLSGLYIMFTRQPRHMAPLYKYVYCSFSNIMSSWCQYEALKYVSFPTQVLAKASKIIPVMIMGKMVSKKQYEYYEYVTAGLITLGMIFFMSGSADDHKVYPAVSLAQQGGFIHSLNFMAQFPKFVFDCFVLSVCSAAGQLFIYYTINTFGAVVFVIIMTIRQGLAILLSCLIYQHHISALGVLGVLVVFFSVFLRIYCTQRLRAIRRRAQASNAGKV
ncbi:Adenosine 3'-phospho 5'-phosphosulfate transporter 1 [Blattella germanica]|nr:Adenosine 3'-phospho 5'-phosphosulfate transporter 1 [Blattella germanica]